MFFQNGDFRRLRMVGEWYSITELLVWKEFCCIFSLSWVLQIEFTWASIACSVWVDTSHFLEYLNSVSQLQNLPLPSQACKTAMYGPEKVPYFKSYTHLLHTKDTMTRLVFLFGGIFMVMPGSQLNPLWSSVCYQDL